jgi:hypothetical protein
VGTKRCRNRQHLYLSIACLMLFISTACVPFKQLSPAQEECTHLESINDFIVRGDFEGAMRKVRTSWPAHQKRHREMKPS